MGKRVAADEHAGHDHGVLPGWPRIYAALAAALAAEACHWFGGDGANATLQYLGMALAVLGIALSGLGVYKAGIKDLLRFKLGIGRRRIPVHIGMRVQDAAAYERLCDRWLEEHRPAERPRYFLLYRLEAGAIAPLLFTEPRDAELRQLSWGQQLVTLSLEARDALAPQLQAALRRLGNLVVVVLTQVIGRAIGLVGRGVLQGLGRSVSRG